MKAEETSGKYKKPAKETAAAFNNYAIRDLTLL